MIILSINVFRIVKAIYISLVKMDQFFHIQLKCNSFQFLLSKFISSSEVFYGILYADFYIVCRVSESVKPFFDFYLSEKSRSMNQITTSLQKPINNLAKFHTFNPCALLVYYVTFGFIVFAFCKERGLVGNHALFFMHCSENFTKYVKTLYYFQEYFLCQQIRINQKSCLNFLNYCIEKNY